MGGITLDNKEKALELFDNGCNCCQATILGICEERGLDKATATKIASVFGGGMTQGELCGTVTGATMMIGMKYGTDNIEDKETKDKANALVKEFCKKFREENGSLRCSELLGYDMSTLEGRTQAAESGKKKEVCPKLVGMAVEMVENL